jgi:hypothetical protein
MMGGIPLLITSFRQVIVDIKFTSSGHCLYWRIYDEVVKQIPEVKSTEDRCPRCGAAMGAYHYPARGFFCPLLWSSFTSSLAGAIIFSI